MAKRSVQAYIEEVPSWEGGIRLAGPPLSGMQWLDWSLATAGTFFEGLIVFMGVIALPLIAKQFGMSSADKGLVTAATLAGLLVSALALGGLAEWPTALAANRCSSAKWCYWRWRLRWQPSVPAPTRWLQLSLPWDWPQRPLAMPPGGWGLTDLLASQQ